MVTSVQFAGSEPTLDTIARAVAEIQVRAGLVDSPIQFEGLQGNNASLAASIAQLQAAAGISATATRVTFNGAQPDLGSLARAVAELQQQSFIVAPPAIFNLSPSTLPNWVAGATGVIDGVSSFKVSTMGSSTVYGLNGTYVQNWTNKLAAFLSSNGVNAKFNAMMGTGGVTTTSEYGTNDPRVTFAGGSTVGGAYSPQTAGQANNILGGTYFVLTNGTSLDFTPAWPFDTVNLTFQTRVEASELIVAVDGVPSFTQSTQGANNTTQTTVSFSCALGTHTLTIGATGGLANVKLMGCDPTDSTTPTVYLRQFGVPSQRLINLNDNQFNSSPRIGIQSYGSGLGIIMCDSNDINAQTAISDFTSRLDSIVARQKIVGDAIIISGQRTNTAPYSDAGNYLEYLDAEKQIAINRSCPILSLPFLWGSYQEASAAGLMDADGIHQSALGQTRTSEFVGGALLSVL